jgi:hypothetical protein
MTCTIAAILAAAALVARLRQVALGVAHVATRPKTTWPIAHTATPVDGIAYSIQTG